MNGSGQGGSDISNTVGIIVATGRYNGGGEGENLGSHYWEIDVTVRHCRRWIIVSVIVF